MNKNTLCSTLVEDELYSTSKRLMLKALTSAVNGEVVIFRTENGLCCCISYRDINFRWYIDHLSEKILYGTTISDLTDEVLFHYRHFINRYFFKEVKKF